MSPSFLVACIQTNSGRELQPNIDAVEALITKARQAGAEFVLLPENVAMLEPNDMLQREKAFPEPEHPAVHEFSRIAKSRNIWLLVGSVSVRLPGGKVANRSILMDPTGTIVARYDKIHLFDVDLGNGESYRESATIEPGSHSVVAPTPWGRLGMSICYDLRFPHLYRAMARSGADFLSIPAAFTRTTGQAHWHVLQRARAIETGCYVFAPAQCGEHAEGRQTFGHSVIVEPWGTIVAEGDNDVGFIIAEVDPSKVDDARRKIPALSHDRPFD
jgi:predicted amidohydrolase